MPAPMLTLDVGETLSRAAAHWTAGQADAAEMACRQVLAVWPGQSDASHLLGLMAHAYGAVDLAVSHMRTACEAPRAPAVYFSNFAEICRQNGRAAEGERAARRAVALDPGQAGSWNNLGIVLQELGRFEESRQCLLRALALAPDDPQTHNNLGNACKRLGLIGEAERHWSRAIALAPGYAEPHSNLANLLTAQSQFDRAAALARRAIDLDPQLADAYLNLAGVETARRRPVEAMRWLRALMAFAPDHAPALAALALVYTELDQVDEALSAARRAVSVSPSNAESHDALGRALQADGQYEDALACFERAAVLPGAIREKALLDQALLHTAAGHAGPAEAAFDAVLSEFPNSAVAWLHRTDLKTVAPGDPSIGRMAALLDEPSGAGPALSSEDRMALDFALGKAYLDTGETERAFRRLDAGNSAKRALVDYDPQATEAWLRSIAAIFSADFLTQRCGQGVADATPVFVVGAPCSGAKFVERLLISHPDVRGAGDLDPMQAIVAGIDEFPHEVVDLDPPRLTAMGQAYLARVARLARGRRHVIDRTPGNFLHVGLIRLILPEARIIHCRRDPVETCLSSYSRLFAMEQPFAYDLAELGEFHRGYQALMAHWRAALPETHFIEVDYEANCADPAGETRRMLEFLGLPWREATMNPAPEPPYAVGGWRRHAGRLGPLLEALGVAP